MQMTGVDFGRDIEAATQNKLQKETGVLSIQCNADFVVLLTNKLAAVTTT